MEQAAVTRKIHRRTVGDVVIYFLAEESIAVAREQKTQYGDMSSYILLQSWHDRNKAPFRRLKRHLMRQNNLTFIDIQMLANRYSVQVSTVSSQIVPSQFRHKQITVFDLLNISEGKHARI